MTSSMDVFVLIRKYILGRYHHFTVQFEEPLFIDNFYITTLHISSQETDFGVFMGESLSPLYPIQLQK